MAIDVGIDEIKDLLRDFSKYITPERPFGLDHDVPDAIGYDTQRWNMDRGIAEAIETIEANTRKVLGDEH